MPDTDPRTVALTFVERINAGDVPDITALLTEDHEFIDTAGDSYRGRDTLHHGWIGYFRLFPDYRIQVAHVAIDGDTVTLVGASSGTLSTFGAEALRRPDGSLPPPEELQGPAIWTARVQDGLLAQWCVYPDTPDARASLGIAPAP